MAFSGGSNKNKWGESYLIILSTKIDLTSEELSTISLLEMKTYNNNEM